MSHVRASAALAAIMAGWSIGHHAEAQQAQSKCLVGKNKCISKKVEALLACEEKAQKPGKPGDANEGGCVDKAKRDFDGPRPGKGCFEKLESKRNADCVTVGDAGDAEALVDACVATLVETIAPPGSAQSKCAAGKIDCVAKKLKGLLSCWRQAQTLGKPGDTDACIRKVRDKFDGGVTTPEKGCFEKLENKSKSDCQNLGDSREVEAFVEDCVDELVLLLEGEGATTTSTTVSTTTSSSSTTTTSTTSTTTSTEASTTTTTEVTTTTTETSTTTTTEPGDTTTSTTTEPGETTTTTRPGVD